MMVIHARNPIVVNLMPHAQVHQRTAMTVKYAPRIHVKKEPASIVSLLMPLAVIMTAALRMYAMPSLVAAILLPWYAMIINLAPGIHARTDVVSSLLPVLHVTMEISALSMMLAIWMETVRELKETVTTVMPAQMTLVMPVPVNVSTVSIIFHAMTVRNAVVTPTVPKVHALDMILENASLPIHAVLPNVIPSLEVVWKDRK